MGAAVLKKVYTSFQFVSYETIAQKTAFRRFFTMILIYRNLVGPDSPHLKWHIEPHPATGRRVHF